MAVLIVIYPIKNQFIRSRSWLSQGSNATADIAIIMDANNRYASTWVTNGGEHIAGKDNLDPLVERVWILVYDAG